MRTISTTSTTGTTRPTRTVRAAVVVGALLASGLVAGCSSDDEFRSDCAAAGGTVESEREKKTRTKTVNGKKKKETYYETDLDCVDDEGNEILDD
jgi:hypothetical protein